MSQTYDDVPYDSRPISVANVNRIAAIAHLFGMTPTSPAKCRVLELGCASGGNLLPMALAFPESKFVGFDLSPVQIEDGKKTAATVGVPNIEFRVQNIFDIDDSIGEFDYIITHGVYSWVPQAVRDKILQVCARHLTPNGVAYVSYNTKPGWGMKTMIREMMQFHARRFDTPREKIQQARMLVNFLAQTATPPTSDFAATLRTEAARLQKADDAYIYHEHLEPVNEPIFLHEFVAHATANGLRYVGDMNFQARGTSLLTQAVTDILGRICQDDLEFEQYTDFIWGRTFRCSLLCRPDAPQDSNKIQRNALQSLQLFSVAEQQIDESTTADANTITFRRPEGSSVTTPNKLTQTALRLLRDAAPLTIRGDELLAATKQKLGQNSTAIDTHAVTEEKEFVDGMILGIAATVVDVYAVAPPVVRRNGKNPYVSPLARYQARRQPWVSSGLHGWVSNDDLGAHLLPLMNGTHTPEQILGTLKKLMRDGTLPYLENGEPVTNNQRITDIATNALENMLKKCESAGLFVAKPKSRPNK